MRHNNNINITGRLQTKITVVCPIYNEERYIASCAESILRQDYPHSNMEILFIDGISTDKTREILREYTSEYPIMRTLDNPKRTVPYAMNIGIKAAKGDIIIRLDAHARYPDNYFSTLVNKLHSLKADNVGAVCRTLPSEDTPKCKAIAAAMSSTFGMGDSHFRIGARKTMEVDTVPFGCYKKNVFEKIGYYDEELIRNQDDELNGRLKKHGGKIYLIPELVIDYFARNTIRKTGKMFYQYGLYKPLVNKKIGMPATIRQFIPPLFVLELIAGTVIGLLNTHLLFAHLTVLTLYLLLATAASLRSSSDMRQVAFQIIVYLTIHINYGCGYIAGIWKIATRQPFNANVNR